LSTAWCHTTRPRGPVVVIDDGDATGAKSVAIAARLALATGMSLKIFAVASSEESYRAIEARARRALYRDPQLSMFRFAASDRNAIASGLIRTEPGFVVADLTGEPFSGKEEDAMAILRAARAPFLLIRDGNESASMNEAPRAPEQIPENAGVEQR